MNAELSDALAALTSAGQKGIWITQLSPTSDNLKAVFFVDVDTGYAVGGGLGNGVILKTRDGGAQWEVLSIGIWNLQSVHFIDASTGWVVGYEEGAMIGAVILHTVDGGESWTRQRFDGEAFLYSVHFIGASDGWIAGTDCHGQGCLAFTRDAGATWLRYDTATSLPALSCLWFPTADRGWASGTGGAILATVDGGRTWKIQVTGTLQALWSVFFLDAQRGWAVGGNHVLRTVNGGETWTRATIEGGYLYSVRFVNEARGWAVGVHVEEGVGIREAILSSEDCGQTWKRYALRGVGALRSLHLGPAAEGFAVGDEGVILKYGEGK